jgi:small nuclear ribonucleoprotein (snRNP)-like protein
MDIRERILNKCLKLTIKDGRIIYGVLHSLDKECNLIIHDSAIQMPANHISPIN